MDLHNELGQAKAVKIGSQFDAAVFVGSVLVMAGLVVLAAPHRPLHVLRVLVHLGIVDQVLSDLGRVDFLLTFHGEVENMRKKIPIAMSSAEAEVNTLTIGVMASMHVRMIHQEVHHGNSSHLLTIPFLMDSVAAMLITKNDRGTQRT